MRFAISMAFLALTVAVAAIPMTRPITPAAPQLQHRAEQMRMEGLKEREIAKRLAMPCDEEETLRRPYYARLSAMLDSFFEPNEDDGISGDISPGSLDAPEIPLRASTPISLSDIIKAIIRGEDPHKREFGYEGKELELRRPEGMRHWNS